MQGKFDGGFEEAEFVSCVVGNSFVNQSPEANFFGEDAHGIGELDFASRTGWGAFEASENGGRKDVTTGDGEVRRSHFGLGFLDEVADAEETLAERREGGGLTGHNAVEMSFLAGNLLDGDGAGACGLVDVDELLGGWIVAGDEHIAEENCKGLVADKVLSNEDGMAKTKGFFLAGVADLDHVADAPNKFGLVLFAFFLEEALEKGSVIEVIFDGILPFTGNDDDVLDAGSNAFLSDILNLGLIDNGEHFLRLGLGGGQEARAEPSGG